MTNHTHQIVRQIVPAAPGWQAIHARAFHDLHADLLDQLERDRYSVYDLCYVEPVPCFALVECWDCASEHPDDDVAPAGYEPLVSPGPPIAWYEMVPVLREETSHFGIPPNDPYKGTRMPDLIIGPGENADERWICERIWNLPGLIERLRKRRSDED